MAQLIIARSSKQSKHKANIAKTGMLILASILVLPALNGSLAYATRSSDNNELFELASSDMVTIDPNNDLERIYTGPEYSPANATQSFAITDKYFVVMQAETHDHSTGFLIATDINVEAGSDNPEPAWRTEYMIGHANGATWNSKTNEIIVVDSVNKIDDTNVCHRFNANTGNHIGDALSDNCKVSIAYNPLTDSYSSFTSDSSHNSGRFLDKNFDLIRYYDGDVPLVRQDAAYNNGYTYRVTWAGCNYMRNNGSTRKADICDANYGEGSSVVYQFDSHGNYVNGFYIPAELGEIESMAFDIDNTPYFMFGNSPNYSSYSVYKLKTASIINQMVKKYAIYFDANGGNEAPATTRTKNVGTSTIIPTTTPTREGYIFLGWSTSETAIGADELFTPGAEVGFLEDDIILYAVWKPESISSNPRTGDSSLSILFYLMATFGTSLCLVKIYNRRRF